MTTRKVYLSAQDNKDNLQVWINKAQLFHLVKARQLRAFVPGADGYEEVKVIKYGSKSVRTKADATTANNIRDLPKVKR